MLSYLNERVGVDEADDLLQAAWLAVLGKIDSDHPSVVGLVWRSIRCRIVDHLRSRRETMPLEVDHGEEPDVGGLIDGCEILAAVADLEPHLRKALELSLGGMSTRQAAKVLGISHTAAGRRFRAAVAALRARFGGF